MSEVHYGERHARLWDALVPPRGRAATVQGELIRATGRLADEAYRNGNGNWGSMHEELLDLVEAVLTGDSTLTVEQRDTVTRIAATIRETIHAPDVSGDGSPLYQLTELTVLWVEATPDPRPLDQPQGDTGTAASG